MPVDIRDTIGRSTKDTGQTKLHTLRRLQQEAAGTTGVRSILHHFLGSSPKPYTVRHTVIEVLSRSVRLEASVELTTWNSRAIYQRPLLATHLLKEAEKFIPATQGTNVSTVASTATKSPGISPSNLSSDINMEAFEHMLSDRRWLAKNLGKFVAFVDGKLIGIDDDRAGLLTRLKQEYPDKPKFFALIEEDDAIEHLPSPLNIVS